jgi:hypothetical protein
MDKNLQEAATDELRAQAEDGGQNGGVASLLLDYPNLETLLVEISEPFAVYRCEKSHLPREFDGWAFHLDNLFFSRESSGQLYCIGQLFVLHPGANDIEAMKPLYYEYIYHCLDSRSTVQYRDYFLSKLRQPEHFIMLFLTSRGIMYHPYS